MPDPAPSRGLSLECTKDEATVSVKDDVGEVGGEGGSESSKAGYSWEKLFLRYVLAL